jgi:hypothetical protein
MSPPAEDRGGEARPLGVLRRIGRAAFAPWRFLRIDDSMAAIRRDFDDLSAGGRAGASPMRLDETGAFDLDASAFLRGQRRAAFEDALIVRQRSTARNAWIFLGLGALFFLGWLYRLMTMTWTANAALTALQFTPACAVFFLLAFRFGLENYQIRMRRKVAVMEYDAALDQAASQKGGRRQWSAARPSAQKRQKVPGGRSVDPPPAPVAHSALS